MVGLQQCKLHDICNHHGVQEGRRNPAIERVQGEQRAENREDAVWYACMGMYMMHACRRFTSEATVSLL
jgi:hypothetical protein